jgi:ribosomal-protein-alanine N-acetyltransferase
MHLRNITNDDFDELVALDHICFADGIAYTKSAFRSFLALKNNLGYLIEEDEKLIAFILTAWSYKTAEIITIDVNPGFRRKGLGTKMLRRVEKELKRRGISTACLHVSVDNKAALEFYIKEGFEVLDRIDEYYRKEGDAFFMVKFLV